MKIRAAYIGGVEVYMKAAMIGDNCIDVYERLNKKYPTGNVVDTGVNLQKLGIPTSIISTTGNDEAGKWMFESLKHEGLDVSHLKTGDGPTAITYMDMNGNDRVHGDYVEGVLENIAFDDEDVKFAASHDLVHSALWGKADGILHKIKQEGNPIISFDYADRLDHALVDSTLPWVDYGFYSYHKGRDSFIKNYLKDKVRRGMKTAVATFGEKGSLVWDGKEFYNFGIFPAKVVNTVGAGDSFIAGFLYGVLSGCDIPVCLEKAARIAAQVVAVFEPWVSREIFPGNTDLNKRRKIQ
jgi:fructoselysine 6-kinase